MSKKQVSFKFDDELVDRLEALQEQFHAASKAEAIRKSLNLASVLASASAQGVNIILENPKTNERQQLVIV